MHEVRFPGIFMIGGGAYSDGIYGAGSGHPKYFEVLGWLYLSSNSLLAGIV